MNKLIAVPALLFATSVFAECPTQLPAQAPEVPSGANATREEMFEAQRAVGSYVTTIESYLECRKELHPLQHSRSVYLAESAAEAYNQELQVFQAKDNMIATN